MKNHQTQIKDMKLYALNLLINEDKTPTEIASITGVLPVVLIGWFQKYKSSDKNIKLKSQISQLENDIDNLKGNNSL